MFIELSACYLLRASSALWSFSQPRFSQIFVMQRKSSAGIIRERGWDVPYSRPDPSGSPLRLLSCVSSELLVSLLFWAVCWFSWSVVTCAKIISTVFFVFSKQVEPLRLSIANSWFVNGTGYFTAALSMLWLKNSRFCNKFYSIYLKLCYFSNRQFLESTCKPCCTCYWLH